MKWTKLVCLLVALFALFSVAAYAEDGANGVYGEATLSEATPGEATPGEATPGEATPGEATPGEATPGEPAFSAAEEPEIIGYVQIRRSGRVNIREESDLSSNRLGVADPNEVFPCVGIAANGWYMIQMENGKIGYVSNKMSTFEAVEGAGEYVPVADKPAVSAANEPEIIGYVQIRKSGSVNIRSESNLDSIKLGVAEPNEVFPCVGIAANGWYMIQLEDGTIGYVTNKMSTLRN